MAYAIAVNDSPLKGSSPVPANTIVTAHDHLSAAAVTRVPASCSGAMNAGVPIATSPERTVVIPGTAASPKSITTGPSGPSMTLPGLKSRCTIPAACTAPSAVSVATAMRSSAAPPRGPNCSTTSTSDGPLTYSLTMNRRRASGRTLSQEHNALPALPEAAEQPVYTHLTRIRVAQGEHLRHYGPSRCHPAILPPAAQRTPAFHSTNRLKQLSRRPPGHPGTAVAFPYRLAWPDDALGRERRNFPLQHAAPCRAPGP